MHIPSCRSALRPQSKWDNFKGHQEFRSSWVDMETLLGGQFVNMGEHHKVLPSLVLSMDHEAFWELEDGGMGERINMYTT